MYFRSFLPLSLEKDTTLTKLYSILNLHPSNWACSEENFTASANTSTSLRASLPYWHFP